MTIPKGCQICRTEFQDNDRVIFSHKSTFIFKPAHEMDTVNPAQVSPQELAESRKDFQKTAVVNTFADWGKAEIPEGAFYFRHQWCEPQKTGAATGIRGASKHAIRFGRVKRG